MGTILSNVIPSYVLGIDIVISTSTSKVTFRIENGVVNFIGYGDYNEPKYTSSARNVFSTPFQMLYNMK